MIISWGEFYKIRVKLKEDCVLLTWKSYPSPVLAISDHVKVPTSTFVHFSSPYSYSVSECLLFVLPDDPCVCYHPLLSLASPRLPLLPKNCSRSDLLNVIRDSSPLLLVYAALYSISLLFPSLFSYYFYTSRSNKGKRLHSQGWIPRSRFQGFPHFYTNLFFLSAHSLRRTAGKRLEIRFTPSKRAVERYLGRDR